ncbi:type II secretion system major pseudopilin GspG [Ponticaulis koreensis]|uniref:type II secretion system major pseudopilin GspG n=1 Tax=Ponticaulis koreensis TaxID=1123045 RepID=UPI0003B30ED8
MKFWNGWKTNEPKTCPAARGDAGFTLTEMLVVMVILGLLAAAIAPRIVGRLDSSKIRAARLQLDTVSASIDVYHIDTGQYPQGENGLDVLLFAPDGVASWDGPYVRSPDNLVDPWGTPLRFEISSSGIPTVISLGADGAPGGDGRAADIVFPDFSQND